MSDSKGAAPAQEAPQPDFRPTEPPSQLRWVMSRESTWDMSKEREFIEKLLNQRFSFFLVFYALVLKAGID